MCFHNYNVERIQAQKDITCYKVMIQCANYDIVDSVLYSKYIGYHMGDSIIPKNPVDDLGYFNNLVWFEGEVVHSYDFIPDGDLLKSYQDIKSHVVVVRCTIPKGTWYWHNPITGQYASLRVVVNEILK